MNYGEVLSRAWQIIWRHKILWIFGILAVLSGSEGFSNTQVRYSFTRRNTAPNFRQYNFPFSQLHLQNWEIAAIVLAVILVILLLAVIAIILGTIGEIGLIRGATKVERGASRLGLGELFSESFHYFWRIILINIIYWLIGVALFALFFLPIIFTCGLFVLCLLPISWFIALVFAQVRIALVADDLGLGTAISRGWQVVVQNLGVMIVMALILYLVIGLLVGTLISLPFIALLGPVAAGLALSTITNFQAALPTGAIISLIGGIIYIPILIVLSGILRGYITTGWTLTYLRLTAPKPPEPVAATF